jgi:hypothetical protein
MRRGNAQEAPAAEARASGDGQSPFHELVSAREVSIPQRAEDSFVAECTDTGHPAWPGRVQITWEDESGRSLSQWVPVLAHSRPRVLDRVLVQRPRGFPEPLVVGVVDGFERCAEPRGRAAAVLEVERGETVQVVAENGAPLLEVTRDADGPVVRVMNAATRLELPGQLQIAADEIVLRARQGKVVVDASDDDVVVTGKKIRLN